MMQMSQSGESFPESSNCFSKGADGVDVLCRGLEIPVHGIEGDVAGSGRLPVGDDLPPFVGIAIVIAQAGFHTDVGTGTAVFRQLPI